MSAMSKSRAWFVGLSARDKGLLLMLAIVLLPLVVFAVVANGIAPALAA